MKRTLNPSQGSLPLTGIPGQSFARTRVYSILALLLLLAFTGRATDYYVSSSQGSDDNSGTSTTAPWQSLDKVNATSFQPGDNILFKRGDSWTGTITVSSSGTEGNPITYGAYGTGDKPKIYGSEVITGWEHYKGNIWKAHCDKEINQLFLNDERMKAARWPNEGYATISEVKDDKTFVCDELDGSIDYEGAIWTGRVNHWAMPTVDAKASNGQSVTLTESPQYGLGIDYGFFLCNKLDFLDEPGEWYYENNDVYFWTPNGDSPNNYTMKGSVYEIGIYIEYKRQDIAIQNFELLHCSSAGIKSFFSTNISIMNNSVYNVELYGIQVTGGENNDISDNYVNGSNCKGISIGSSNSIISDNTIQNSALFDNLGLKGTGSSCAGQGISLGGQNNKIRYNRIINCGDDGISFCGAGHIFEYNFINNVSLMKDDGGGIYGWGSAEDYYTTGTIVRYNIIMNVEGNTEGLPSNTSPFAYGVYCDNGNNSWTIEGNSFYNIAQSAITFSGNNHLIQKNTLLGCFCGLKSARENKPDCKYLNNIVACNKVWSRVITERYVSLDKFPFTYDYNTYVSPYRTKVFARGTGWLTEFSYSFEEWQNMGGQDLHSTINTVPFEEGEDYKLFYNDSKLNKTFDLGTTIYKDIYSEIVTGSFSLEPFTSRILIKTSHSTTENKTPEVEGQSFSITEEKQAGELIAQVVATDANTDQELFFSITGGNDNGLFSIDSVTGEISTTASIAITDEKSYSLTVTVSDNFIIPASVTANITIDITPPPDTIAPVITSFELPQNVNTLEVPIASLSATDNEAVTGYLLSESADTPTVGNTAWSSSPPGSYTFDAPGTYTLYIWAIDAAGNISSAAQATVNITLPAILTTEEIDICEDNDYLGWKSSGEYERTLTAASGADSIVTTLLTVHPILYSTETITIYEGESYEGRTTAGTYERTLSSRWGCDSIVTTTILVLPLPVTQTISLQKGWNIFSARVLPEDTDLKSVVQDLCFNGYLLEVEDENGNSLKEVNGEWINNIGNLQNTEGYKIKVSTDCELEITGQETELPLSVSLNTGANLVSFPYPEEMDAMQVIRPLIDAGLLIKMQDERGNAIEYWESEGAWVNQIGNCKPGEGYQVQVNDNGILTMGDTYDKSGLLVSNNLATYWFEPNYEGNGLNHMNINIQGLQEMGLQIGDELAAFDGETCVGAVKLGETNMNNNMVSIPASASDQDTDNGFTEGNTVELKAWSAETNEESAPSSTLEKGNLLFSKYESVFIQLSAQTVTGIDDFQAMDISMFPNPARNQLTLTFSLEPEPGTTVCLCDMTGKQILSREVQSYREILDVSSYPSGMYLVQTRCGDSVRVDKLVIE